MGIVGRTDDDFGDTDPSRCKEHPALKNLHDQVVRGDFKWERWGLMRCLSDFILNYSDGDILEIGCGESSIHFTRLAEMYGRKCYHIEFSKSGVENMRNTKGYFGANSQVYNMKSDDFFDECFLDADIQQPNLTLAFIDGDHTYDQAKKDFDNVLPYMLDTGYIFLHDTYPRTKEWTVEQKCGTVYLLRRELEQRDDLEVFTFPRTAFDVGLTMVRKINKNDL